MSRPSPAEQAEIDAAGAATPATSVDCRGCVHCSHIRDGESARCNGAGWALSWEMVTHAPCSMFRAREATPATLAKQERMTEDSWQALAFEHAHSDSLAGDLLDRTFAEARRARSEEERLTRHAEDGWKLADALAHELGDSIAARLTSEAERDTARAEVASLIEAVTERTMERDDLASANTSLARERDLAIEAHHNATAERDEAEAAQRQAEHQRDDARAALRIASQARDTAREEVERLRAEMFTMRPDLGYEDDDAK